jgi:hypothetical protein
MKPVQLIVHQTILNVSIPGAAQLLLSYLWQPVAYDVLQLKSLWAHAEKLVPQLRQLSSTNKTIEPQVFN